MSRYSVYANVAPVGVPPLLDVYYVVNADGSRMCECFTKERAERIASALTILEQLEELGDTYRQVIARGHE